MVPHMGGSISPPVGDPKPSKPNPSRLSPYKDPKKCDIVLGDTPEELDLYLGLNLIIYVLKQATNHWIPSLAHGVANLYGADCIVTIGLVCILY